MSSYEFEIVREIFQPEDGALEGFTLGKLYGANLYLGETGEDQDRHLEDYLENDAWKEVKVYGKTAIPCGRWPMSLEWSPHFQREMPHIKVPTHENVMVHGGNGPEDVLGCVLAGRVRLARGVAQCAAVVDRVIGILKSLENSTGELNQAFVTIRRAGE